MNREINDEPSIAGRKYDPQTSLYLDKVGMYEISTEEPKRRSPYAGVSDDGREFVGGRVNPLVGKLTHDMENMRKDMEVMQMIMRGFAARRNNGAK